MREKKAPYPDERKLDSHLIYPLRSSKDLPVASSVAALGVKSFEYSTAIVRACGCDQDAARRPGVAKKLTPPPGQVAGRLVRFGPLRFWVEVIATEAEFHAAEHEDGVPPLAWPSSLLKVKVSQ